MMVSGQCDKGMLLGELCPVQLGYDMGCLQQQSGVTMGPGAGGTV
jgi:hypothetical protein